MPDPRSAGGSVVLLLLVAALRPAAVSSVPAAPQLIPLPDPFRIAGTILHDRDVSTIVRGPDGVGLIAADEGAVVQILAFAADGRGARIVEDVALVRPPSVEIDIEAATWHDGWFYVTGSHGVAKKRGAYEPDRAAIFRFRLATGEADLADLQRSSLAATLDGVVELAPFLRRPLQRRGLNVEGLAARAGDPYLYVGLRSPNLDGDALILRVDPEQLFDGRTALAELLRVGVGAGLGIRAMTAVGDSFLLVLGNAGSEPVRRFPQAIDHEPDRPSELVRWDPATGEARRLGVLPAVAGGKEEGVLILAEEDDGALDLVVVYDGIAGGGFRRFRYMP